MSAREIRKATSFRISGCTCCGVHITLLDADGKPFAAASFSPEAANRASVDLAEVADLVATGSSTSIPADNPVRH